MIMGGVRDIFPSPEVREWQGVQILVEWPGEILVDGVVVSSRAITVVPSSISGRGRKIITSRYSRNLSFFKGLALGQVCHVVELAIQKKLLAWVRTGRG